MLLPQEIEVWYVLPAIRREMCKEMVAQGLTQRKTAGLFGITEAAVSQYITSKRAGKVKFNRRFLAGLKDVCTMIREGKMTAYEGQQVMCRAFKESGQMCAVHKSLEKPGCVPQCCAKSPGRICRR